MTITAAEATQRLLDNPGAYQTEDALRALVNEISVEASGKTTLLYSGPLAKDATGNTLIDSRHAVQKLVDGGADIRVIDKTEVAKFLDVRPEGGNTVLRNHLLQVFGTDPTIRGTTANNFLHHGTTGLWAVGSKNFVQATVGEVITLTPHADLSRTFGQTELPTALADNSRITSINGRSLEALRAEYKLAGSTPAALSDVFKGLNSASGDIVIGAQMRFVMSADGTRLLGFDPGRMRADLGFSGLLLPEGDSVSAAMFRNADATQRTLWQQGSDFLKKIDSIPGAHAAGTVVRRGLPFLGLTLASVEANAAYESGDVERAKRIMADAAAETLGSIAGEIAIGALVGAGAVAVGIGAVPAAIIGVVSAVVAGYVGGDAATRLMGWAREGLADLGIDIGIGTPEHAARNPSSFDLAVDTQALQPTDPAALGSTSGGWGLLGGAAGYRYAMPSEFVNENGLRNTAFSGFATDFVRPGNLSLADTDNVANSLRVQAHAALESQRPLGAPTVMTLSADGFEIGRSEALTLVSSFDGATLEARVFYDSNRLPIGIQALESRSIATPEGAIEYQSGTYYVFPEVSDSAGVVSFNRAPTASSVAPYMVILEAGRNTIYIDPVVLDEGSDGVRLSAAPVSFDLDADGNAEPLPWAAPSDPLLVIDRFLKGMGQTCS